MELMVAEKKQDIVEEKSRDFVGSLVHGLNVIMAFDAEHAQMTLSEVAEITGMNRAGARRYLLTLAHLGFIRQDERLFRLTPKVMELGYSYLSTVPITTIAQPYLNSIRDITGESVAVGVIDGADVVHIVSANSERLMAPTLTVGRRFSVIYASAGRMLLALKPESELDAILDRVSFTPLTDKSVTSREALRTALAQIRRQRYALVDQEIEVGARSLAVPVFNKAGQPVAAINVLVSAATVTKKELVNDYLPVLWSAAQEMTRSLVN
jgi:IclR family pca regulon transcriptional regulator